MQRRIRQYFEGKSIIAFAFESICFFICIYGIYKSIWMNSVGVSFWVDEAMLSFSFSKRGLLNLTFGIFEWNQIAPIGWLYINKIMAIIFGNTEFVVRLFSVFSYAATLFLIYYLSKQYFHMRLPLLCPAYIASMSFALQYSIMFKPYMSDGMFAMIVVLTYLKYKESNKRFSHWILGIIWAILLWFSNPVCFVAGGIILSEIVFAVFRNVKKVISKEFTLKNLVIDLIPWIVVGGILVASFVGYYFYWLRPVAIGDYMQDFWKGQNFPLFPKSSEDLEKMDSMKNEIFCNFSYLSPIMMFGLISTLVFGIYKKNRTIIGLYLGIFLMLFASYINMFPVQDRMWYYFYPLAAFLFFLGMDKIFHFDNDKNGIASLIVIVVFGLYAISGNYGFEQYATADKVYRETEELNYEVEYIRANIKEDEKVYVYHHSVPGFQYKNGYNTYSIGNYENNVVYGSAFLLENEDYSNEIEKITTSHNCYIAMSHWREQRIYGIKYDLPQLGWLELVKNDYSTPLLFWTDDINKTKSMVDLSIVEMKENEGIICATIRIDNTGETILNSQFNRLKLVSTDYDISYDIPEEIGQGSYLDIKVEFSSEFSPLFKLVDTSGKTICSEAEIQF